MDAQGAEPRVAALLEIPEIDAALVAELNPFARAARTAAREPHGERFRVGELARRSGVAVGTIKYYLREGLLPAGVSTSRTQALYDVRHLRRLRTIRVLGEVGGLTVSQIGAVAAAIDEGIAPDDLERTLGYALATAASATAAPEGDEGRARHAAARAQTDSFIDALGLHVCLDSPARDHLASAFALLVDLGFADDPAVFLGHAKAAYELAAFEIATLEQAGTTGAEQTADDVVVGTVVFGAAFMALRAMSHEHEVRRVSAARG